MYEDSMKELLSMGSMTSCNFQNLDVSFFEALTPEQVIAFTPRQWHDMNREQANAAMDIWFGYDQWPYSYLKGFREAGEYNTLVFQTLNLEKA